MSGQEIDLKKVEGQGKTNIKLAEIQTEGEISKQKINDEKEKRVQKLEEKKMEYHHRDNQLNAEERSRQHETTRFIVAVVAITVLVLGIIFFFFMKPSEVSEVRVSNS